MDSITKLPAVLCSSPQRQDRQGMAKSFFRMRAPSAGLWLRVSAALVLLAGVLLAGPSPGKSAWRAELDLEPSLRSAALVVAVRVQSVDRMRVVYGGKSTQTLYQYTFTPMRVLKGVYSRPELVITDADLRSWANTFDPDDIESGQQRLLLLGRSNVGYAGIHPGSSADEAFPRLDGEDDPLLAASEVLLSLQDLNDRREIVRRLTRELGDAEGRGAVALLAALDRRSYIAAQHAPAVQSAAGQLTSEVAIVRETAANVLGGLLQADYLKSRTPREAAVAALAAFLEQPGGLLAARVAGFRAMSSATDVVGANEDAVRLVSLDAAPDTLAELAVRLDVLGRLYEGRGSAAAPRVAERLEELPLDAPSDFQRMAARSWARIEGPQGVEALLDRIQRKKTLGLDGAAEVGAFGLILPKTADPWPLQRRLVELGLTPAEKVAFVQASERSHPPRLVTVLSGMLDPAHLRLRRLAADLLMEIDSADAARALRPHLAEELDLRYKLQLAAFLGRHGIDDGYSYAIEHMSDPRYLEAAVEAVAAIGKAGSADQLVDIYESSNDIRWQGAAVRALGLLEHAAFHDEMVSLTRTLDHPLAAAALQARADLGDAAVMAILPDALSSRNEEVVVGAANAAAKLLSQGSDARVRSALATLATDSEANRSVRRRALEALVSAGDARLDEVLVSMIRDVRIEETDLLDRVRELLRERSVRI